MLRLFLVFRWYFSVCLLTFASFLSFLLLTPPPPRHPPPVGFFRPFTFRLLPVLLASFFLPIVFWHPTSCLLHCAFASCLSPQTVAWACFCLLAFGLLPFSCLSFSCLLFFSLYSFASDSKIIFSLTIRTLVEKCYFHNDDLNLLSRWSLMRWWRTWWTLTFCSWARIPPLNILSTRQWPLPRVQRRVTNVFEFHLSVI